MPTDSRTFAANQFRGLAFGLLGVVGFSATLPATRLAVASFDPFFVGLGREIVAATFAASLLIWTRQPWPNAAQRRSLRLVIVGVIFGFPVCSAWAMQRVDASHGAVILGLLPLATAIAGFLRANERPSVGFWIASAVGSFTVVGYSLSAGGGSFRSGDWALLASVLLAALGYAEGGRLGREIGGWQVICWALVFGTPLLLPIVGFLIWKHGLQATPSAWAGFFYVSLVSAFLGFFAWYHGLAIGGVARVGQIQLLQPFFTLAISALFLGEHFSPGAAIAMTVVALSIFAGRRAKIQHVTAPSPAPSS